MKQQTKPRKTKRKTAKAPFLKVNKNVKTIKSKALRHFKLVEHKHTGKLVQAKHTSHVALMLMLAVTGFLIYISHEIVIATSSSGSVSVGLVVPGPPPTIGATINSPKNGDNITTSNIINVSGTCSAKTFVTVYNNSQLTGSTICTNAGIFNLDIQLIHGQNVLTALNYDNLNQPGPITPAVTLQYSGSLTETTIVSLTLPSNPALIPGITTTAISCFDASGNRVLSNSSSLNLAAVCTEATKIESCQDYKETRELPTGGDPQVVVVCTPRSMNQNDTKKLGILIWGGTPPYAINVDLGGKNDNVLISQQKPGYRTVDATGSVLGVYSVKITLKDANNKQAIANTSFEVTTNDQSTESFAQYVGRSLNLSWFETPVPIYIVAVAITLGFWGGDIFFRNFGAKKFSRRAK